MDTGSERSYEAPEATQTARDDMGVGGMTGADDHLHGDALPPPDAPEAPEEDLRGDEAENGAQEATGDDQDPSQSYSTVEKVRQLNRFVDEAAKGLDPISMNVWLVLFRFAQGGIAWASQQTIAERLGLDVRTVRRHLKVLQKKQLLRVVEKGNRGGRSNTYQLGILPLEPVPKRPGRPKRKPR